MLPTRNVHGYSSHAWQMRERRTEVRASDFSQEAKQPVKMGISYNGRIESESLCWCSISVVLHLRTFVVFLESYYIVKLCLISYWSVTVFPYSPSGLSPSLIQHVICKPSWVVQVLHSKYILSNEHQRYHSTHCDLSWLLITPPPKVLSILVAMMKLRPSSIFGCSDSTWYVCPALGMSVQALGRAATTQTLVYSPSLGIYAIQWRDGWLIPRTS